MLPFGGVAGLQHIHNYLLSRTLSATEIVLANLVNSLTTAELQTSRHCRTRDFIAFTLNYLQVTIYDLVPSTLLHSRVARSKPSHKLHKCKRWSNKK